MLIGKVASAFFPVSVQRLRIISNEEYGIYADSESETSNLMVLKVLISN